LCYDVLSSNLLQDKDIKTLLDSLKKLELTDEEKIRRKFTILNSVILLLLVAGYYTVPFILGILINLSYVVIYCEGFLFSYMFNWIGMGLSYLLEILLLRLGFDG
jgi:hypothetical protein